MHRGRAFSGSTPFARSFAPGGLATSCLRRAAPAFGEQQQHRLPPAFDEETGVANHRVPVAANAAANANEVNAVTDEKNIVGTSSPAQARQPSDHALSR